MAKSRNEPDRDDVRLRDELAGRWQSVVTGRVVELVRNTIENQVRLGNSLPKGQPCEVLFRCN